jgi:hypothetical protein
LTCQIRRSLVRQLFAQKELIDKRTKIHTYDGWLAQKYNFRHKTIIEKSLDWRVEKVVTLSESQSLVIHDICRHFLTKVCTITFQEIQTLGNADQPEPAQNKYPMEWYMRVVDYLATQSRHHWRVCLCLPCLRTVMGVIRPLPMRVMKRFGSPIWHGISNEMPSLKLNVLSPMCYCHHQS